MRILCTNDDGIHAEGIAVLERIALTLSDDVWVVAPDREQSGASRALTLSHPIRVRQDGPRRFAVSGTPTDAVLLGAVGEWITRPTAQLAAVRSAAAEMISSTEQLVDAGRRTLDAACRTPRP